MSGYELSTACIAILTAVSVNSWPRDEDDNWARSSTIYVDTFSAAKTTIVCRVIYFDRHFLIEQS